MPLITRTLLLQLPTTILCGALFVAIAAEDGLQSSPCILKPLGSGPEVVLVLLPASNMKPVQYLPLAKAVQDFSLSSPMALWVGLAAFDRDEARDSKSMGEAIGSTLSVMVSMGLKQPLGSLFLAAHSQEPTAALLQDYLAGNSTLSQGIHGLILLGAFLKRSYRSSPIPFPILTIGGELDGVCRITRVMEEYVHRVMMPSGPANSSPVVVVGGMTHLQFASGEPSPLIKKYDLKPEINDSVATNATSHIVSSFVSGNFLQAEASWEYLNSVVADTGTLLGPLIEAYSMEGAYKFKPPCYENPPSTACQVGSQWTEVAMTALADLDVIKLADEDAFHPADEIIPTYHHPKIASQPCTAPSPSCLVNVTSVTDNIYDKDERDTGLVPTSACEMRAKLKSRQSVLLTGGYSNVSLNTTDGGSWCQRLNQLAYISALANYTSPAAKERFVKYGSPMRMVEDRGCQHNGGLWIYLPIKYSYEESQDKKGVFLAVSSVQLTTDVKYPIGIFAGMHYCKLLSPARVAEWVYVDGLREQLSLSGAKMDLPLCGL